MPIVCCVNATTFITRAAMPKDAAMPKAAPAQRSARSADYCGNLVTF